MKLAQGQEDFNNIKKKIIKKKPPKIEILIIYKTGTSADTLCSFSIPLWPGGNITEIRFI